MNYYDNRITFLISLSTAIKNPKYFKDLFKVCVCVGLYECECKYPWRSEVPDPRELVLQVVVGCLMHVLRTALWSSGRVVCTVNH